MSHRDDCTHTSCPDVRAVGVTVRLGETTVLDGVDVHATGGRLTGLVGPNGSGKTTLLHTLAGLRRPEGGEVRIGHDRVGDLSSRDRARRVALVEQHATTGADLTLRQVVALGRLPHRRGVRLGGSDEAGADVVDRALNQVGLSHLATRRWTHLSGGERQRAHLARALAQEPEVLLLDEPTNHLDLGQQLRFMALVRDLGITAVAALHDLELAAAFCDEVVVLSAGSVHAAGSVRDTLTGPVVADVYGVRADLTTHPRLDRPHLVWDEHLQEAR